MLTLGFDTTILNVALPTLAAALGADTAGLQWIVTAYVLVFAGLLLPAGAFADRLGRKRFLIVGLALFGLCSVVASYATSTETVIASRALMGLAAAILTPTVLAVIPALFGPAERPRAIAIVMMSAGVGIPLGPILGGWLLRHFWWGSVFLVNVPVAAAALVAALLLIPETKDPAPRPADVVGGLLSVVGLVAFVYGVIEVPTRGWSSPVVLAALGAGVAVLAAFVAWERRTPYPMIDLKLFARPRFLWGSVAATLATFALAGLLFVLPQFLQDVKGFDPLNTGLRLVPMMAGLMVGAGVSEKLITKLGNRIPVALGLAIIAGGLALGATTEISQGYGHTATWLAIVGVGVGTALAPAMEAVLSELPPARAGAGTAITMTLRQVGAALGVALLGSVLSAAYTDRLDLAGLPAPAATAAKESIAGAVAVASRLGDAQLLDASRFAFVHAMDVVLLVCAALAAVGAVLSALLLTARATEAAGEEESVHELVSRSA
jgi:EmrB/QacA subfamily drug resistance transporter